MSSKNSGVRTIAGGFILSLALAALATGVIAVTNTQKNLNTAANASDKDQRNCEVLCDSTFTNKTGAENKTCKASLCPQLIAGKMNCDRFCNQYPKATSKNQKTSCNNLCLTFFQQKIHDKPRTDLNIPECSTLIDFSSSCLTYKFTGANLCENMKGSTFLYCCPLNQTVHIDTLNGSFKCSY